MPSSPNHASQSANNAPLTDETTITDLSVIGTLPVTMSGQYLRVGKRKVDRVAIHAGHAVSYQSRSFATDATSVIAFGSSFLAFEDGALAYELSADLDTTRSVDLAGASRFLTAHPEIDPVTDELHLLTLTDPAPLYVSVSPGGLTRTVRSIDNAPSRIWQLALARDFVVLLADGFVGVTSRTGVNADATWFAIDTDARHIAAASAHGETVVVYATGPSLERWTLHRRATLVGCEVLDATPQAFSTRNGGLFGEALRFLWTVGSGAAHKHDLLAGTRRSHHFDGDRDPGGLVFVADPDRGGSDDGGWLVGFVHDETGLETDLVVLDAQEIERPAVAAVRIPRRIPNGGPGTWVPTVRI
jgi:carotenoid cleavage dioxygenase-like enzyme